MTFLVINCLPSANHYAGPSLEQQVLEFSIVSVLLLLAVGLFVFLITKRYRFRNLQSQSVYRPHSTLNLNWTSLDESVPSIPGTTSFSPVQRLVGILLILVFLLLHSDSLYFPLTMHWYWW